MENPEAGPGGFEFMCAILLAKVAWAAAKDTKVATKVRTASMMAKISRGDIEIDCMGGAEVLDLTKSEVADELQDAAESCAVHEPWRKKEEILPLLIEEDSNSGDNIKPQQPNLKPLPVEFK